MNDRILCVDDDPNVLHAYERALRKRFRLETALGPEEALEAIEQHGPYAVVVADMRMPGMNGVELLARVKVMAPDTVRMMLTGNADQQTALDAVNEGAIFRFLTKPCPPETFAITLDAALRQHQLITAERDLLSKTLSGSVKVLTDVLALVNPTAFGCASRVRRLVTGICSAMKLDETWQIEIAAMLSQLGCVTVAEDTLTKLYQDKDLSPAEREAIELHPLVGAKLLSTIPRLEPVAEIISHQNRRFDDRLGLPGPLGGEIPMGSRVLKAALDYDMMLSTGLSSEMAVAMLNDRSGWYDPAVLAALREALAIDQVQVIRRVTVAELTDGMVLADDVKSLRGTLLCARGQEVNSSMRIRLRNYVANVGVQEAIKVFVPLPREAASETASRTA